MIAHAQRLLPTTLRTIPGFFFRPRTFRSDILWLTRGYCFSTNYLVLRSQETLRLREFGRSWLPVFMVQLARCYRVKKDTNLTSEEEFICKIAKVSPFDVNTLRKFQQRLKYLVDIGCKPYELVEYPNILHLTKVDIDERIKRLNLCDQTNVSMPLLQFAKPESSDAKLRTSIRRYLKQQNGHLNKVNEIRSALQCTQDEMLDILTRNPRLIGRRKRKFIVEKVNCLLHCGARIEDVRSNTNLLNNKTLEVVESRARRLVALGYNDPLPMGVIGRDDDDFEVIVARLATQRSLHPTSRYLESREIVASIPEYANRKLYVVKPKVDFLLSRGYVGEEIVEFPSILEASLEAIHDSVTYLQSHHLSAVSLEMCHRYATKKSVASRQGSSRKILAKVLGCKSVELPLIPKDVGAVFNSEATLCANYEFLRSVGFASSDLRRMPIVLAHDVEVLKRHWDVIQVEEGLAMYFELWKKEEDKGRLLHLLQFSVEKETNFCRIGAADVVGDGGKRAEDTEADVVDYEAEEFVELDRETGKDFRSIKVDATVKGRRGVEVDSADVESDRSIEHDPGIERGTGVDHGAVMEHGKGVEPDTDLEPDTHSEYVRGVEHDRPIELDSGDVHDADIDLLPGVELHSRNDELDLDAEFDRAMKPVSDVEHDHDLELDLGVEHDSDVQFESCMERDLDLYADPDVGLDPSAARDGDVENTEETENISDVDTSSDEESSVGMENDMTELFPSSAHCTSFER